MKPEARDVLEMNKKRFVEQITTPPCARCGKKNKINNRYLLPFEFEKLNDKVGKIWMVCPRCGERYDLGIIRYS